MHKQMEPHGCKWATERMHIEIDAVNHLDFYF